MNEQMQQKTIDLARGLFLVRYNGGDDKLSLPQGKSVEIINGEIPADSGKYEWGTTVSKAYPPNDNTKYFTDNLPLMDWLRQFVPSHVTDVDEPF